MSLRLQTERLILREPEESDAAALLLYYRFNDARFARWEPEHADDIAYHLRWIAWRRGESVIGRGVSLLALDRGAPDALAGIVNLYDIQASTAHSAMLGYSIDGAYEGRGYAREAIAALIAHAFGPLNLHRLSANYHPANERSGTLLRRLGFAVEGYARDLIFLRGTWRDHILTSLTNPAWREPEPPPPA